MMERLARRFVVRLVLAQVGSLLPHVECLLQLPVAGMCVQVWLVLLESLVSPAFARECFSLFVQSLIVVFALPPFEFVDAVVSLKKWIFLMLGWYAAETLVDFYTVETLVYF